MRNPKILFGVTLLVLIIALALIGPTLAKSFANGDNPLAIGNFPPYQLPSPEHPIGTDGNGRDGMAVFLVSIMSSLRIGLLAGVVATTIGIAVGFSSGYLGGVPGTVLRIFTDMVLVFPILPLMLTLALLIDRWSLDTLAILLGLFGWAFVARVIRPQVLSLRERSYVDLARLSNENTVEIIIFELLPGLLPYIGYSLSLSIVGAMLAEAGLQLIGIGASTVPTLGLMIGKGIREGIIAVGLIGQMLLPALLLILTFLSLNMINLGLDEVYNPRLRTVVEDKSS
jgi:peptide/nickel transport system permease protein